MKFIKINKDFTVFKSTLFKDSFWALSGNAIGKSLALIASIVIARLLGKDIFGMYGLIRTTLLSVAVFSTFGLGYTATKFVAEYVKYQPNRIPAITRNIMQITIITALVFALLLFIFCKQIATYLEASVLYNAIRYLAVIVIFNSITTTQVSILAGFKKFKTVAHINLINGIFMFVCSVTLTYYFGLSGALLALLLAQILNCAQNYIEVRKNVKSLNIKSEDKKYSIKKELITFSLPIALQEMQYSIFGWITPILLAKFSNFGEVGIYNATQQWSSVILFIPGALRNVILSHISSTTDNHKQQVKILKRMLLINFLATFIPFIVVFIFSGFIEKMYGKSFVSLKTVLNVSVFTTIFSCMSTVFYQYFLAINKVWISFWCRLGMSVVVIVLFIGIMKLTGGGGSSALHMAQSTVITQIFFFVFLSCLFIYFEQRNRLLYGVKKNNAY